MNTMPPKDLFKKIFSNTGGDIDATYEKIREYQTLMDEVIEKRRLIKKEEELFKKRKAEILLEIEKIQRRCNHPKWTDNKSPGGRVESSECEICGKVEKNDDSYYDG